MMDGSGLNLEYFFLLFFFNFLNLLEKVDFYTLFAFTVDVAWPVVPSF